MSATEMRRSWLVQRLTKPRNTAGPFGAGNPFAFGGGLRNGGLSDDAMKLLQPIFDFDYMGAAEFEFGAVPEALSRLAEAAATGKKKAPGLVAGQVEVDLSLVPASWRHKDSAPLDGTAPVYYLARSEHADEVERRIAMWATEVHPEMKERLGLTNALRPFEEWDSDVQGWLEISNGFMFFVDRGMWAATAAIFGVQVEVTA